MLQVAISGGEIRIVDVPAPAIRTGFLLIQTSHSLISAGTEGAGVTGRSETLAVKALKNPQLVKKVVERMKTHGFSQTMDLVRTRMGSEMPIGYSAAGIVVEVGDRVDGFRVGDRVACAGAGYANHAEYNVVPANLVAPIPDGVTFEEAAFVTLGAIALHGVRRAEVTLGESVVVLGLGLLGQLTAQFLTASGARVLGVDVVQERVSRAKLLGMSDGFSLGERDLSAGVMDWTAGRGADAVIVCAAGADPSLLNRAFDLCRRRGRVVLVGDVPIRIQREKIYKKEIDFRISTSYGPGRYDPTYEEKGVDYPIAYVRWTEGRNLAEVLRLMKEGRLSVKPLVDRVFPIEKSLDAYLALKAEPRPIGVLIEYGLKKMLAPGAIDRVRLRATASPGDDKKGVFRVGIIGFGGYFSSMLLPILTSHKGFRLESVCSRNGLTVRNAQSKYSIDRGYTRWEDAVADPDVDVVFVTTRHDQHFPIASAAVVAGKNVFVEKPMTMSTEQAIELCELVDTNQRLLTVGFNRRFSPHAVALKQALNPIRDVRTIIYRVNAGSLPADHWLHDPKEGGGRILGEGVHFFDLMRFFAGSDPVSVASVAPRRFSPAGDSVSVIVQYADGSTGTLIYTSQGASGVGKERVEVHTGGSSFVLDDYRRLVAYGSGKSVETRTVDKGQSAQLENFYQTLRGRETLGITALDGYWATWCAERALDHLRSGASSES